MCVQIWIDLHKKNDKILFNLICFTHPLSHVNQSTFTFFSFKSVTNCLLFVEGVGWVYNVVSKTRNFNSNKEDQYSKWIGNVYKVVFISQNFPYWLLLILLLTPINFFQGHYSDSFLILNTFSQFLNLEIWNLKAKDKGFVWLFDNFWNR